MIISQSLGNMIITRILIQKIYFKLSMQKLISLIPNRQISTDHYIINNIIKNSLNKEIEALFLQANNCVEDENFLDALKFYDSILKIDSKNINALIDKGTTLQILGRIKLAIRCFNKSLEFSPENIDALINKGSALHLDQKYFDAIACYDQVLQIDDKCSLALAYKGLSLGELGNLTEAIDNFKKALSVDKYCTLAEISMETAQSLLNSKSRKL